MTDYYDLLLLNILYFTIFTPTHSLLNRSGHKFLISLIPNMITLSSLQSRTDATYAVADVHNHHDDNTAHIHSDIHGGKQTHSR